MSTGSLGLQGALLLGGILDNSLGLVITDLSTLLVDIAHLSGPLGALGECGVTTGLILTLLILDGLTLNNIIFLLLGPALRLILSSTDLRALYITVLDQGSS